MIFTFSNGDVIKTSEIVLVSAIKELYISKLECKFYYKITLKNKTEIEKKLTYLIKQRDVWERYKKPKDSSFYIFVSPICMIDGVEKPHKKILIPIRDIMRSEINIKFEELESFKFFSQERLDLINKLT